MTRQLATIDDYISSRAAAVQFILNNVRSTIRSPAPGASERISYQMPAITLNGRFK